ncbi:uncharacterized protein LOC124694757 [Lolium rigidum]|uniref:uncharacterized protein LOC124694757 n=1 Tax=Lolium rigidum TaxID=89674 RepID=UPI001F5C67B5|nr:uncharacterized protein LOC124694757 [Lolium rigidum]
MAADDGQGEEWKAFLNLDGANEDPAPPEQQPGPVEMQDEVPAPPQQQPDPPHLEMVELVMKGFQDMALPLPGGIAMGLSDQEMELIIKGVQDLIPPPPGGIAMGPVEMQDEVPAPPQQQAGPVQMMEQLMQDDQEVLGQDEHALKAFQDVLLPLVLPDEEVAAPAVEDGELPLAPLQPQPVLQVLLEGEVPGMINELLDPVGPAAVIGPDLPPQQPGPIEQAMMQNEQALMQHEQVLVHGEVPAPPQQQPDLSNEEMMELVMKGLQDVNPPPPGGIAMDEQVLKALHDALLRNATPAKRQKMDMHAPPSGGGGTMDIGGSGTGLLYSVPVPSFMPYAMVAPGPHLSSIMPGVDLSLLPPPSKGVTLKDVVRPNVNEKGEPLKMCPACGDRPGRPNKC